MAKGKQTKRSPIVATSYRKRQTGQKTQKGNCKWETIGKVTKETKFTSFSDLKKKTYENSKKDKSLYVSYKPHIVSVTKKMDDGTKVVTYFNRARAK